jgi:HJR/Mrr/RecB family endonuclease
MSGWHYIHHGIVEDEAIGPISEKELLELAFEGEIRLQTKVMHPQQTGGVWVSAETIPTVTKRWHDGARQRQDHRSATVRQIKEYVENGIERLFKSLSVQWQPAPPHLRRCLTGEHHQFSTHSRCFRCDAYSVGLDVSQVIAGQDFGLQQVLNHVQTGQEDIRKAFAWSLAIGVLLIGSLLVFSLWFWAAIAFVVALAIPVIVIWRVNRIVAQTLRIQKTPPIAEKEIDALFDHFVGPFLLRNENPDATSVQVAIKRHKTMDHLTSVTMSAEELTMIEQVLPCPLWNDRAQAESILNAFALRDDYFHFEMRMRQLEEQETPVYVAYASLATDDETFLPFLKHLLSERGVSESQSKTRSAVAQARHTLRLKGFSKDLKQRQKGGITLSMDMVDQMDPFNFEFLLGMIYECHGYRAIETPKSGDQGADVLLEKAGERTVVQAKLYSTPVGNKAVQEAIAARSHFRCQAATVVTNNYFTPSARELAGTGDVELVDRDGLVDLITFFNRSPKDYGRLASLLRKTV